MVSKAADRSSRQLDCSSTTLSSISSSTQVLTDTECDEINVNDKWPPVTEISLKLESLKCIAMAAAIASHRLRRVYVTLQYSLKQCYMSAKELFKPQTEYHVQNSKAFNALVATDSFPWCDVCLSHHFTCTYKLEQFGKFDMKTIIIGDCINCKCKRLAVMRSSMRRWR